MTGREVAWRVVAREVTSASEEERGTGERAASYLVTPLGARANRVLLSGRLSVPEMVGRDEAAPFYRTRLSDPTGEASVTAGGFQPRALAAFRLLDSPRAAMVVGKAHLYRGRDGNAYPSIRAEAVHLLPPEDPWSYLAESLDQVVRRFDLSMRFRQAPPPGESTLLEEGFPLEWVRGAALARERYPTFDLETFRPSLEAYAAAVEAKKELTSLEAPTLQEPPRLTITRESPQAPRPPATAEERARESAFLDILDELAEASLDGYANLADLVELARARGIGEREAEELVGRLEESGAIEEPIVGKLRRA